MPTFEHVVSNRNGSQVMVKGLSLRSMGYRKGSHVVVSDPAGIYADAAWQFIVSNNEHSTLTSKDPSPPSWIQPGVRIRVDVQEVSSVKMELVPKESSKSRSIAVDTLAEWRRSLIKIISRIEKDNHIVSDGGLASRIGVLSRAGHIPREVAQFMRTVTELRNEAEYNAKILTPTESEAVGAAWRAVTEWDQSK